MCLFWVLSSSFVKANPMCFTLKVYFPTGWWMANKMLVHPSSINRLIPIRVTGVLEPIPAFIGRDVEHHHVELHCLCSSALLRWNFIHFTFRTTFKKFRFWKPAIFHSGSLCFFIIEWIDFKQLKKNPAFYQLHCCISISGSLMWRM